MRTSFPGALAAMAALNIRRNLQKGEVRERCETGSGAARQLLPPARKPSGFGWSYEELFLAPVLAHRDLLGYVLPVCLEQHCGGWNRAQGQSLCQA